MTPFEFTGLFRISACYFTIPKSDVKVTWYGHTEFERSFAAMKWPQSLLGI
jgi:hypothetical protein